MKKPTPMPFKPAVSLANATGNPEDGYDLVVLSGFKSAVQAENFAQHLLRLGIVELPAAFEPANSAVQ